MTPDEIRRNAEEILARHRRPGRHLLQLGEVDSISLVDRGDNPGAVVAIHKRAEPLKNRNMKEFEMASLTEIIAKALEPSIGDSEKEAMRKAIVKKQLDRGVLTIEGYAAELLLEAHALSIAKRDKCSYEVGFVRAIDENPDVARLLD